MTEPEDRVAFRFDGVRYEGRAGIPVGIALYAAGVKTLGRHEVDGAPRGLYCLIGQCFECRVLVHGRTVERACLLPLTADLDIRPLSVEPPLPTHPGRSARA